MNISTKRCLRLWLAVPLMFSLSSCAFLNGKNRIVENKEPIRKIYASKLFIEPECPISTPYEALVGAELLAGLLTSLVDRTLGVVSNAIEALGADKVDTGTASASSEFYKVVSSQQHTLANNCLIYVEGWFGKGAPVLDEEWSGEAVEKFSERVGLISVPNRFIELGMKLSSDGSAFLVRPRMFHFRSGGENINKGERDVAISAIFQKPSVGAEEDTTNAFAAASVVLNKVRNNTFLDTNSLSGIESGWVPIRPLESHEIAEMESAANEDRHGPYTVFVTVNEAQDASKFLKVLAGTFADNKEDIASEVKRVVLDLANVGEKGKTVTTN